MSTGGTWFALLRFTHPILKACWRLTLTAVMQVPGFVWEWVVHHKRDATLLGRWALALPRLTLTGLFLGAHFATWSWAVENTSLTHSLLFVSSGPLIIVVRSTLLFLCSLLIYPSQRRTTCGDLKLEKSDTSLGDLPEIEATEKRHHAEGTSVNSWKEFFTLSHWISESSQPPTLLECVGTALGFSGAALLVLKSTEEIPAEVEVPISLEGDFAAFLGALMFVLLLDAGRTLRQWMPLFIYTFPVTLTASISLGAASLIMEDTRFLGLGGNSWFGWAGGGPPLWYSLGGAAVAGMMGHLLCYLALLHIIPLVVSIMCLFEPLFGSVIGWLVGVQGVPGIWTLVAGSMLMLGAILVTFGDRSFTVNWSTLCSR